VLLDVARAVTGRLDAALPNEFRIDPTVLLETMAHQEVEISPGDIVCIRTGWTESYLNADAAGRQEIVAPAGGGLHSAGITPDVAELAQAQQWGVVTADNPAVESTPMVHVGSAHVTMQRNLGLLFGELFIFGDLARDCDADSRWTFFFVAAPLLVPGGMGSPGCAIAIR
jgi:kynurenine formamidase